MLLLLPLELFAVVTLSVGFVASKTIRQAYGTPFFHLFFSDTWSGIFDCVSGELRMAVEMRGRKRLFRRYIRALYRPHLHIRLDSPSGMQHCLHALDQGRREL